MRIFRRRLKVSYFTKHWQQVQEKCSSRKTWPEAVMAADQLLDKALKQSRFKGKTTGERLVAAQRDLSFNEAIWFSHKFSIKLAQADIDVRKLKKKDVLLALAGFREALRDLGALEKHND